jgi:glycosyltransferase involved in cell wall biosynthesis
MTSTSLPKISCLTVTTNRLILLKEAIDCYCRQTYPNRELVIATDGSTRYQKSIASHLDMLGRNDIRLICLDKPSISLGQLRNRSLEQASGDIICQWDDDDLYHPERLRLQFETMMESDARSCYLTDHLHFYAHTQSMYWVDWRYFHEADSEKDMVPGSMMAYYDEGLRYNEVGPDSAAGEDNAFRRVLCEKTKVARLSDRAYLYIYRFHGRNTMPEHHHQVFTRWGSAEADYLREREGTLRRALASFRLPMPYTIKSRGEKNFMTYNG